MEKKNERNENKIGISRNAAYIAIPLLVIFALATGVAAATLLSPSQESAAVQGDMGTASDGSSYEYQANDAGVESQKADSLSGDDVQENSGAKSQPAAASETETAYFTINGMTCGSCVYKIEYTLGNTEGIKSIEVNLRGKSGVAEFYPDKISAQEIADIITGLGYPAQVVEGNNSGTAAEQTIQAQPSYSSGGGCGCGCGG